MSKEDHRDINNDKLQLTQTESIISSIWSELFKRDMINPNDNFFELGGDSLMTMMVLFRVNDVLHIDLPPGSIVEAPTLREFCQMIDSNRNTIESHNTPDNEQLDSFEIESGVI